MPSKSPHICVQRIIPLMQCTALELAGDERRAPAIMLFDDLHQISSLVGGESIRPPIVQDQQINLRQGAEQTRKAPIAPGKLKVSEQSRDSGIERGVAVAARLLGERA